MKKVGAKMEWNEERLSDLMDAYYSYLRQAKIINMTDVYNHIVNMPAKRFWVSDIRAALVVAAIFRGEKVLENMWPLKREMYEEIYNRVMTLKQNNPNISMSQLCAMAIAQPAPKFYLTPGSAKMMICKARKQRKINKRQRFIH